MIKAVAIDDEPRALEVIEFHAVKIPQLELVECFTHPEKALEYLNNNIVDLVFLDINMPGLSGMELIKRLTISPLIIFTTAYSEYALDSYNYDAVDYLLKPIEFDRFYKGVHKAMKMLDTDVRDDRHTKPQYFFAKDGYKQVKIIFKDILYVRSNGNYLDIHCINNKKTMVRMSFSQLKELIPKDLLLRVHNSFMVNPAHIHKIENNHIFLSDFNIPIGIRYKDKLFELLNI